MHQKRKQNINTHISDILRITTIKSGKTNFMNFIIKHYTIY